MKKTIRITVVTLLSVIAVFAMLLSSCKKSSTSGTSYYVKGNVNGTLVNYTGFTSAIFTTLPGSPAYYVLGIQGQQSQNASTNLFGIVVTDLSQITTKTYTDATVGSTVQGVVSYYDNSNNQYSSAFAVTPGVTITISEITSTYVAGTFSGTVTDISSGQIQTITNGSFKVKKQ